ncbi:MAG: tetratricopeptide repeat protein [Bacteroidota bacterium]|nr:tetratricopeptide repeat protein [Bacteroidota bacterium]MDW8271888.1 tetratricopeptide repeat protein [Bacteroidota bacterium]
MQASWRFRRWQLIGACAAIAGAAIALYWHTLDFGYTDLDDLIFIRERESFNRDAANLWRSFSRGVFVDSGDTYYRPLLLWTFIADRHRQGRLRESLHREGSPRDSLRPYRMTNIVLHIGAAIFVFFLLRHLVAQDILAWLLSLIYSVHPALVQAVVWIPGRNDSLLGIATFSYALALIAWINQPRWWGAALQFLLLTAAMLTKETALIVGPTVIAAVALLRWQGWRAMARTFALPLGIWLGSTILWAILRSHATVEPLPTNGAELAAILWERLPLYLQYLGKSLIPLELSVFPRMEDTSLLPGTGALALLMLLLWQARHQQEWRSIVAAILWFVLFLLPALVVPRHINQEAYEHRLYVPIVGILWLIGQIGLHFPPRFVYGIMGAVAGLYAVVAWQRCESFRDKFVFWEEAVRTSPHSAYARMMLGARYYLDKNNPRKEMGERLLWEAYRMDSTQKYINYYIGNLYWDRNEFARAKPHYQRELSLIPRWPELYFRLARIAFEEGQLENARVLLERQLELDPTDPQANHNLLLLYLDTKRPEKAKQHALRMQQRGLTVPPDVLRRIEESLP